MTEEELRIRKEIARDLRGEAFVARHEPIDNPLAKLIQGLIADAYHRAARIAEEGLAHELTRELR